ncbi:CbiX/SirB N-terminal domain-containing protein [Microbacterium sp. X-17]|uniref:sirohydrochlorin chelatase n=1 Tax=Microbacterium sp. X-17 TaxID=3144404 RepID=UPI0031F56835
MALPALLAVSHGTSSAAGRAAVSALVDAVAAALPEVTVRLAHVDVQQPDVAAGLAALPPGPVVIVPLLLSAGYHVRVDLVAQARARAGTVISPALGPDPRLVDALVARIHDLAPGDADAIVLAVAGSSDARANADCVEVGALLERRLGREVTVGFLAAAEPRLGDAVAHASERAGGGQVVVATYLLAPGHFHDLAERLAGTARVARPLLDADPPFPGLVDLVVDRYRALAEPATA